MKKNLRITKSKDNKHLYVRDIDKDVVKSYQLVKRIPNCHYLYILSHTFQNYLEGMFGKEIVVTDKVEDLGFDILYIHKTAKR